MSFLDQPTWRVLPVVGSVRPENGGILPDSVDGPDGGMAADRGPSARRRVLSRIRLGHVVMVLAALFALLLNLVVLRDNRDTIEVAVAATDISAGITHEAEEFAGKSFAEIGDDPIHQAHCLDS